MNLGSLNRREEFGQWLNDNGLLGEGAEIGCAFGGNAETILKTWKGQKLYFIDPWIAQPQGVYKEKTAGINYEAWYENCVSICKRDPRGVIIRKFSVDAANDIPDDSLVFAYLDANHDYEHASEDLDLWFPKVKMGGLLCGHDYYDSVQPIGTGYYNQVRSAVTDWLKKHPELSVRHTDACSSWWIEKK